MSNYSAQFTSVLNDLESTSRSAKQRVEQLQQLGDYLEIPIAVQELCNNQTKENAVKWDNFFIVLHKLTLEFADKYLGTKAKSTKEYGGVHQAFMKCCSVLQQLLYKSSTGKPYLASGQVISCCLEAFEHPNYRDILKETYISILLKCVLSKKEYWGEISLSRWNDLYTATRLLYDETIEESKRKLKTMILSCLNLICFHGSKLKGFTEKLKEMLTFASNLISEAVTDLYVLQMDALELCYTLIRQLKKESRFTVCQFSEQIMPNLIAMFEASCGNIVKKKELLANIISEIVSIHHPCGVTAKAPGSYADDWDAWLSCMDIVYRCLCEELDSRRGGIRADSTMESIIRLLVQVYKLNSAQCSPSSPEFQEFDDFDCPPVGAKRRKVMKGIENVLYNFKYDVNDGWPWLSFIEKLMRKYPDSITTPEYEMIFTCLVDVVPSVTSPTAINWLCRCTAAVVDSFHHFSENLTFNKLYLTKEMDKFMNTSVGVLRNSKKIGAKNASQVHSLVQALLRSGMCSPASVQSVLDLYLENQVPLDSDVLGTLAVLCDVSAFTETSPVRIKLLQWLVGKDCDHVKTGRTVSRVCLMLLCRTKQDDLGSSESCEFGATDLYFLESSLDATHEKYLTKRQSEVPKRGCCSHDSIIETLKVPFLKILEERTRDMELMNDLLVIMNHTMLLHGFHSVAAGGSDWGRKWEYLFEKSAALLVGRLEFTLRTALNDSSVSKSLESTTEFFKAIKHTPELASKIRSNEISRKLFELLKYSYKHYTGVEHLLVEGAQLPKLPIRLMESVRILAFMTYEGHETNEIENALLQFCLKKVDLYTMDGFIIAMSVLENLIFEIKSEKLLNDSMLELVIALLRSKWCDHHDEVIRILNFLKDLVPLVFKTADEHKYTTFCTVVSRIAIALRKKKAGSSMLVPFTHLVGTIIKMKFCVLKKEDEGYNWNEDFCKEVWSEPVTTPIFLNFDWLLDFEHEETRNSLHLRLFLLSPFNEVRMVISEYIPFIYKYDPTCEEDAMLQRRVFEEIVRCGAEVFEVPGDCLTQLDVKEELLTRSCCALKYLTSIAAFSPAYRRRALFALFELVASKNITIELALKAMTGLQTELCLSGLSKFLNENARCIISSWYRKHTSFIKVPYRLLGCMTYEEFLSNYKSVIVPLLLENRDRRNLKLLGEHLSVQIPNLITECYPEVMGAMLPGLAEVPSTKETVEMYEIVEREIKTEHMQLLLGKELDKVLVCVYERLHDEEHFVRLCGPVNGAKFPQNLKTNIKFSQVRSICHYLENRASTPNLFVYLGQQHQIHIHAMLHCLRSNIQNASLDDMRYLSFHQFATLAFTLAEIMKDLGSFGGYVARVVVHQLLSLTKTNLELHAVTFLYRFLEKSLPETADFIDDLLSFIVPTMATVILKNKDTCEARAKAAGQVLKLLMVDSAKALPSIKLLDPLPRAISTSQFVDPEIENQENLRSANQTLRDCIEHFLQAGSRSMDITFREQGLRHLHQELCSKKEEIHQMYVELKSMRNFSEQCASSILHRLIISLVELATSKTGKVSELAAVCLGELGPRDLTTLVLKPEPLHRPPSLSFTAVKLLLPLLVSDKPELAAAAVSTLLVLLKTKEGYSLVMNGDGLEKLDPVELSYISPFWKLSSKSKKMYSCETESVKLSASLKNWCPEGDNISHADWLKRLVASILECCQEGSFFECLIPIAQSEVDVAEGLLPYLAKMILLYSDTCSPLLRKYVNLFFEKHYTLKLTNDTSGSSIYLNRATVQCMLSLVNFCRLTTISADGSDSRCLSDELGLNYLHVASAAQYCYAYFTAVLYSELWTDSTLSQNSDDPGYSIRSMLEKLSDLDRANAEVLQGLLWESYEKIGESDAVHGCGDVHFATVRGRVKFYIQMKNWSQVINECEFLDEEIFKDYLVHALRMSGKYDIALSVSKKRDYECSWRLNKWDMEASDQDYSSLLYSAIMSIKSQSCEETRDVYVMKAQSCVVDNYLAYASLEVANSIYEPLTKLRTLREVKTQMPQTDTALEDLSCFTRDVGRWEDLEPILSVRKILSDHSDRAGICLKSAALARKAGAFQIAHRFLKDIDSTNVHVGYETVLEEAKLVWKTGCTLRAKYLLKELLTHDDMSPLLYSSALITYGTWLAETKSELTKEIMKNQFEKAAELVWKEGKKQKFKAAECLARFADSEYQRLHQYKNSSEYKRKEENFKQHSEILEELNKSKNSQLDPRYFRTLDGQHKIHKDERIEFEKALALYLKLAAEQYMMCLVLNDDEGNDLKVFRLVSLWMNNQTTESLLRCVENLIKTIPSYKFLTVLNQLIVRLTDEPSRFNTLLINIIKRCSLEHPYHSLPLVLGLANSHLDDEFTNKKTSQSKRNSEILEPRIKVAKKIVQDLSQNDSVGGLLSQMVKVVEAYVSLANYTAPSKQIGDYKIPSSERISKIKRLSVPCLTANIPIRKEGKYTNLPEIVEFDRKFGLVGGINSPKKVKCLCSDGLTYLQLVKGLDDLRQDAGMQQVFGIMNILLRNEGTTSKRRLLIRTYKVVPTSQKSGVIEWVANTQPMGDYLVGSSSNKGAHQKYRPQDMTPMDARRKIAAAADAKKSPDEKYRTYLAVCDKLKPVMRYFFTEKYPTPGVWFERRLAYTRSIATNSMIGYILGIGDRHVANILIDLFTAEVVHIDFGMAFEFGRFLPTPETIPFRLTRDIVDGMGVSGTEGIFRRCCEETLSVMRKAKDAILTTLEVFLYDPLANWESSVKRVAAKRSQRDQTDSTHSEASTNYSGGAYDYDDTVNFLAEGAVHRLKEKVEGREEGHVTSVEGQVSYLITSARNPRNLAVVFHGWQPYV